MTYVSNVIEIFPKNPIDKSVRFGSGKVITWRIDHSVNSRIYALWGRNMLKL